MKTVRDLIREMSYLNPDAVVVMSKDGEGNSFSPLASIASEERYIETSRKRGELANRGVDSPHVGVPAVVLWPTS